MAHEEPAEQQVELEVVVAGTPEEVWEAIATGRGISAWLHPTEVGLGRAGPLGLQARLYGDDPAELAACQQPAGEAWLRARIPAPTAPA